MVLAAVENMAPRGFDGLGLRPTKVDLEALRSLTSQVSAQIDPSKIGGSDAPIITGVSKWCTKRALWKSMRGGKPRKPSASMVWGQIFEPAVALTWATAHGVVITKVPTRNGWPRPWQRISTDFVLPATGEILEVKTWSAFAAQHWTDGPPLGVQCQAQYYMEATGAPRCWIAVLIGGSDLRECVIERNREQGGLIVELCEKFWRDHVLTGTPPPKEESDDDR